MAESFQPKDLYVPLLLVAVVFLAVLIFPPLGALAGILAPVPLIFVYLQRGQTVGLILIALVFGVLLALMGMTQAMMFLAEYAVMAILMAETIRMGLPLDRSIFFSALAATVVSLVLLFVMFSDRETTGSGFFQEQIQKHFDESMKTLESMGESPEEVESMRRFAQETAQTLARSYPAFILVGSLITAAVNYGLVRWIWIRFYGAAPYFQDKFSQWVFPDAAIWLLILSGVLTFLTGGALQALGLNVFIVMLVIYFFQGMAVSIHLLEAKRIPKPIWVVVFFLVFLQPVLLGIVIGLGVFDIWADFRKLRRQPAGNDEENGA